MNGVFHTLSGQADGLDLSTGRKYELDAPANKDFQYLTKTHLPKNPKRKVGWIREKRRLERDKLFAVGNQIDRNFADRVARQSTVRFQQLGDHDGKFFRQSLNGLGFGDEPGDIVAGRDPDFGLGVPFSVYGDLLCWHLKK